MTVIQTPVEAVLIETISDTQRDVIRESLEITDTPDDISIELSNNWDQLGDVYTMPTASANGNPTDKLDDDRIVVGGIATTNLYVYDFNDTTNTWAQFGSTFTTVPYPIFDVTVMKTNRVLVLVDTPGGFGFYLYDYNGTTFTLVQFNDSVSDDLRHTTRLDDTHFAAIDGAYIDKWVINEGTTFVREVHTVIGLFNKEAIVAVNSTEVIIRVSLASGSFRSNILQLYRLISTTWTLISDYNLDTEFNGLGFLDTDKFIASSAMPDKLTIATLQVNGDIIERLYTDKIINIDNAFDSHEKGICALLTTRIVYIGSSSDDQTYTFELDEALLSSVKTEGITEFSLANSAKASMAIYEGALSATPTLAEFTAIIGDAGLLSGGFCAIVNDDSSTDIYLVSARGAQFFYIKLIGAV